MVVNGAIKPERLFSVSVSVPLFVMVILVVTDESTTTLPKSMTDGVTFNALKLTVTFTVSFAVHFAALLTVTIYDVVVTGDTAITAVVSVVLHKYLMPPEAVNVALLPRMYHWN